MIHERHVIPAFTNYEPRARKGAVKCMECFNALVKETYTGRISWYCAQSYSRYGVHVARGGTCDAANRKEAPSE